MKELLKDIGTEREVIKRYGTVKPCFDLHPHQIQPEHIVITSPWFNTREVKFGRNAYVRTEDKLAKFAVIERMRKDGARWTEIGQHFQQTPQRVQAFYKFILTSLIKYGL